MWSQSGDADPVAVLRDLQRCLRTLDQIGAPVPAIHLATAIECLREQFDLTDDPSDSD